MKALEGQKSKRGSVMQCRGYQLWEAAAIPWAKGTQGGIRVVRAGEGS